MNFDGFILDFFFSNQADWITFLAMVVTYTCGYLVTSIVSSLSVISFLINRQKKEIIPFLISIFGSLGTVYILKEIFDRSRPILSKAIYIENSSSLPSGHAALSIALYGFLIYTIIKHDKHPLKNPLIILLSIPVVFVGVSRLYLGVHYFTDVILGYIVGFIWLKIAIKSRRK